MIACGEFRKYSETVLKGCRELAAECIAVSFIPHYRIVKGKKS